MDMKFLGFLFFYFMCDFALKICEATNRNQTSKESYVIRYLEGQSIIPVAVELDFEEQTEYVTGHSSNSEDKSVTFYDFIQRKVAYKDLNTSQCFIADLIQETLETDRIRLKKLSNGIVRGFYLPTFIVHKEISNPELLQKVGQRVAHFCERCIVFLVQKERSQLHRKKREVPISGSNGDKGQFTHHSYGHYGHQSNNYAHYGHETHVTGTVDKDGVMQNRRINQHQSRVEGSQSYPPSNARNSFQTRTSNGILPLANSQQSALSPGKLNNLPVSGNGQFALQTSQESGYQLNLPLGLTAGNSYQGGIRSQGQYGVGGVQPQLVTDFQRYPGQGGCCGQKIDTQGLPSSLHVGVDQPSVLQPGLRISGQGPTFPSSPYSGSGIVQPTLHRTSYPSPSYPDSGVVQPGLHQSIHPVQPYLGRGVQSALPQTRHPVPLYTGSGVLQPALPQTSYPASSYPGRGITDEDRMIIPRAETPSSYMQGYRPAGVITPPKPSTGADYIIPGKYIAGQPHLTSEHQLRPEPGHPFRDTRTKVESQSPALPVPPQPQLGIGVPAYKDFKVLTGEQGGVAPELTHISRPHHQINGFHHGPGMLSPGSIPYDRSSKTFITGESLPPGYAEGQTHQGQRWTASGQEIKRPDLIPTDRHKIQTPAGYLPDTQIPSNAHIAYTGLLRPDMAENGVPSGYDLRRDPGFAQPGSAASRLLPQGGLSRVPSDSRLLVQPGTRSRIPSYSTDDTSGPQSVAAPGGITRIPSTDVLAVPDSQRLSIPSGTRIVSPVDSRAVPPGYQLPGMLDSGIYPGYPSDYGPGITLPHNKIPGLQSGRHPGSEADYDERYRTGDTLATGPGSSAGFDVGDTASSQTQLQTRLEGTAAEATSAGRYRGLGSQSQVQGGYSGNGSFSAQAQSGFTGGITQSQVQGGKQGGLSESSAQVERVGSAQSQVQVGQPSGAASSSAQGRFYSGMTQVQAESGRSGGTAAAQSQSSGLSSSQVQVNVAGKETSQQNGFQGSVSASVHGGYVSGQSQTQLQGGYDSGRTYVATAQGGFDSATGFQGVVPPVGSIPNLSLQSKDRPALIQPVRSEETVPTGPQDRVINTVYTGLPQPGLMRGLEDRRQTPPRGTDGSIPSDNLKTLEAKYGERHPSSPSFSRIPGVAGESHEPSAYVPAVPQSPELKQTLPSTASEGHQGFLQPGYQTGLEQTRFPEGVQISEPRASGSLQPGYWPSFVQPSSRLPGGLHPGSEEFTRTLLPSAGTFQPGYPTDLKQRSLQLPGQQQTGYQLPDQSRVSQTGIHSGLPAHFSLASHFQPSYLPAQSYIPALRPGFQIPGLAPDVRDRTRLPGLTQPTHHPPGIPPLIIEQRPPLHPVPPRTGLPDIRQPGNLPTDFYVAPSDRGLSQPGRLPTDLSVTPFDRIPSQPGILPTDLSVPPPGRTPSQHGRLPTDFSVPPPGRTPSQTDRLPTDLSVSPPGRTPRQHGRLPTDFSVAPPGRTPSRPDQGPGTPGARITNDSSCCEALKNLKERCCGGSLGGVNGNSQSSCCTSNANAADLDDELDDNGNGEPCKVVKAICYIVYKPVGKARICKPTSTSSKACR